MTKSDAIKVFGTQEKLADVLGISQAAISKFPEDQIPKLREYEIKEKVEKLSGALVTIFGNL